MTDKIDVKIPDIGGATGIDVIEILVKKGDKIDVDSPLITLESDKASMEIPSPSAGVVDAIRIKLGDKVSEGDVILTLIAESNSDAKEQSVAPSPDPAPEDAVGASGARPSDVSTERMSPVNTESARIPDSESTTPATTAEDVYAGPAVRRLAHELGVNLDDVGGSGRKSRITKEDVHIYVKNKLSQSPTPSSNGLSIPTAPQIDFSQFGEIELKPLNKIKRITGTHLHRSWITVPHVTQFDEADITDLEAFRKGEAKNAESAGYKLTVLAFVCKVVSKALAVYPQFNASLDAKGENLIYKQYVNIGIAVDTPNGLVVPVIKSVNRLSITDIAKEMARLSTRAREKGLTPADMSGGCFSISSLGGIGGTAFTPIVNSPEVAILGLSRASIKPVYQSGEFKPRLILPLSLSYDHRVIDGAEAAHFTRFLAENLSDIRRILL